MLQLAQPGAFPLQLSLSLLTGVVLGGLGSLIGAIWGAALLVLLPNWTNDLAHSFSLSTEVAANLPLAIYGVVLIGAMLVWPTGSRAGSGRSPAGCGARGDDRLELGAGGDAEQGRLDRAQSLMIAPDADRRVVVDECLRQPHDRVGQRLGVGGGLEPGGRDLCRDQPLDAGHGAGLHEPAARGQPAAAPPTLLLQQPP